MPTDKDVIKQAIKEARAEERVERGRRSATNELLSATAGIFGIFGFFLSFLPKVALSALGLFILGGGIVTGGVAVFGMTRTGSSLSRAIVLTALISGVSFALSFGVVWYFTQYLPNSGQPLFNFGK